VSDGVLFLDRGDVAGEEFRFFRLHEGVSQATAFFITRADFTTCGRNILPAPKRSPTTPMPSISGPSMTLSGRPYFSRASSVSSSMNLSMPLSSACSRRFSTGSFAPGKILLDLLAADWP
jgi:hypothetical protein